MAAFHLLVLQGLILDEVIARCRPKLALELGGFLGYSAVRIADRMKDFRDVKLYSVEPNPHHQDVMQQMIGHAGLSSVVQIVPGTLQSHEHWSRVSAWRSPLHCLACLARLLAEPDDANNKANSSNLHVQELPTQPFDFIFVDHIKSAYVSDLELLVQKGFVKKGTVVVADNIWLPGVPEYRAYMRVHTKDWSTEERWSSFEYSKYLEIGFSTGNKVSQPALTLQCFVVQDLVLISTYKGLST
eukprot:jgi/Astpho2/4612/Aster-00186